MAMKMLFHGWKHITVDALIFRSLQKINPPRASTRPGLPHCRHAGSSTSHNRENDSDGWPVFCSVHRLQ